MKTYSDDSITIAYVNEAAAQEAASARQAAQQHASWLDEKQTAQIDQLRIWLAVSFVVNVALTLALRFL
jgi:hypothetical protein